MTTTNDEVIIFENKKEITAQEACKKYGEYYIFFIDTFLNEKYLDESIGYVFAISKNQIALLDLILKERASRDYSNIITGFFRGNYVHTSPEIGWLRV